MLVQACSGILVGKPDGQFARHRRRWEDNIKVCLREIEEERWPGIWPWPSLLTCCWNVESPRRQDESILTM